MKRGLSMRGRRAVSGYLFILPFIIGFVVFMIAPLLMSLQMTFSQVDEETISSTGFELRSHVGYGDSVTISKEISLPEGYRYNEGQYKNNVYTVERIREVVALEKAYTLGASATLSRQVELPDTVRYDEAALAQGVYTVVPAEGETLPLSFAAWLIDNGHGDLFYDLILNPDRSATFQLVSIDGTPVDMTLDYAMLKEFIIKNVNVTLKADRTVALTGVSAHFGHKLSVTLSREVELPEALAEVLQYDAKLLPSGIYTLTHKDSATIPTDFTTFLLQNHPDLFLEEICDSWGNLYPTQMELPFELTYDADTFASTGALNVTIADDTIPFSFVGEITGKGGLGVFFSSLVDLVGLENYSYVLTVDPTFNQLLLEEIIKIATHTIAILVVAFVIAILLNQEFKGRALVRAIFFLPVILSSGVLVNLETDNILMSGMQELISEQTPFTVTDSMMDILRLTGLGGDLLDIVFDLIAEVYDIVMASGIQIVVFLSGLQNVPASLYEAADVEGCTKWESFWMITFPMVSPLLIVNIIYTIVDFFTKMDGDLARLLDDNLLRFHYDYASTMSWIYFFVTLVMIGFSAVVLSKGVVSSDE